MNQHFDVDTIKAQIDIVDLISRDEPLKKQSDTYRNGSVKPTISHFQTSHPKNPHRIGRARRNRLFDWALYRPDHRSA